MTVLQNILLLIRTSPPTEYLKGQDGTELAQVMGAQDEERRNPSLGDSIHFHVVI